MAIKPTGKPVGAPSQYRPEYCQRIIENFKKGGTIETFAAELGHSKQTIYNWMAENSEFLDARKTADNYQFEFYLNMGKMIASGQLRRVKSEKPILVTNKDGKQEPLYDKDGKIVYEREYESTTGGQSAWIFIAKNVMKWRDRVDINHGGQEEGTPISVTSSMSPTDKEAIKKILKKALEKKS